MHGFFSNTMKTKWNCIHLMCKSYTYVHKIYTLYSNLLQWFRSTCIQCEVHIGWLFVSCHTPVFFSKVLWTKNDTLFLEGISHTVVNVKPLIYFSKHCKRIKKTNTGSWNMANIQIPPARRLKTIFFRNMDVVICIFQLWFVS